MGARRLRDWLALPLANATEIHLRQDAVGTWMRQSHALEQFRAEIKSVRRLSNSEIIASVDSYRLKPFGKANKSAGGA